MARARRVISKEIILEAAVHVFAKSGFEKTLISEIAKEAGIAVGSVYNYFENKNALYEACSSYIFEDLLRVTDRVRESGDFKEKMLEAIIEHFKEKPDYAKMALVEDYHYAANNPLSNVPKQMKRASELVVQLVFDMYEMPDSPINKELLIALIVGGCEKLILSWLFFDEFGGIKNYEQLLEEAKKIFDYLFGLKK